MKALLNFVNILKNLISAHREENWKGHLQAIQDMIPVFCQTWSINYQRYCSLYFEMMRKVPEEHTSMYKAFMQRKFVVKTSSGFSNAVAPDMKLEQSGSRRLQVISWSRETECFCGWMGTSIPRCFWHQ